MARPGVPVENIHSRPSFTFLETVHGLQSYNPSLSAISNQQSARLLPPYSRIHDPPLTATGSFRSLGSTFGRDVVGREQGVQHEHVSGKPVSMDKIGLAGTSSIRYRLQCLSKPPPNSIALNGWKESFGRMRMQEQDAAGISRSSVIDELSHTCAESRFGFKMLYRSATSALRSAFSVQRPWFVGLLIVPSLPSACILVKPESGGRHHTPCVIHNRTGVSQAWLHGPWIVVSASERPGQPAKLEAWDVMCCCLMSAQLSVGCCMDCFGRPWR